MPGRLKVSWQEIARDLTSPARFGNFISMKAQLSTVFRGLPRNGFLFLFVFGATVGAAAPEQRLVDALLEAYEAIETVSCEVRRTSRSNGDKRRTLSRVQYKRPDRINVFSRSPIKRRHVADGDRLYYHVAGDPKGFSRPIEDLDREWLISLRQVPGTAMNHLLEIGNAPEDELPPTEAYPVRRGYRTDKPYIVLSLDEKGRLCRVEYFETPEMRTRVLGASFSGFFEPEPGAWISRLHEVEFNMHGIEKRDTVQFVNMVVNEPLAEKLFEPGLYFDDLEFVDDFEKIYK